MLRALLTPRAEPALDRPGQGRLPGHHQRVQEEAMTTRSVTDAAIISLRDNALVMLEQGA